MELDSVFWLTSGTKLVTAIACMQLVEKGVLRLDDVELVEKLSPVIYSKPGGWRVSTDRTQELEAVQVLQDDGTLVPKERGITIRMLLTHTGTSLLSLLTPTRPTRPRNSRLWLFILQQETPRVIRRMRLGRIHRLIPRDPQPASSTTAW